MASKNAKKREKFAAPEPVPTQEDDAGVTLDAYVPNYGRQCEICGETPCVSGVLNGRVVYDGSMCGVCTWGEAACADPANW
jgi:hypothetical protein